MKKNSQNILRLTALTFVFALVLSGCGLLGANPKGLAKETIDWLLDIGAASQNPLKYPGQLIKAASLAKKVANLSERDKQIYNEELGRIVGSRAADILTILRRDETMAALLSSEGMGALLDTMGLGELGALVSDERLPGFLADAGAALASSPVSGTAAIESDIVLGGFLGGLFGSGSSSPTTVGESAAPEETKEKGGLLGFIGGLFGGGSKSADSSSSSDASEETKEKGGILGFIGGLFGGGSKSGGTLSGGKPTPLAANATHRQAMAKYDEVVAYLVKNPPAGTTQLEIDMMERSLNQYKGMLQLAGLAWSDKESRDGMIEVINNMIAELE
jgi:hypothetical protein